MHILTNDIHVPSCNSAWIEELQTAEIYKIICPEGVCCLYTGRHWENLSWWSRNIDMWKWISTDSFEKWKHDNQGNMKYHIESGLQLMQVPTVGIYCLIDLGVLAFFNKHLRRVFSIYYICFTKVHNLSYKKEISYNKCRLPFFRRVSFFSERQRFQLFAH